MHAAIEVEPSETAMIDPSIIGGPQDCYVDIGVRQGRSYGETLRPVH
jgi:hypothetical protein